MVPVIADPCGMQWYANVPAWVNLCSNVIPEPVPESQSPSARQPPEQDPEVVEWVPPTQTQRTVSPTWMLVVLVPLI
jgi:hypothetical protein